MQISTTHFKKQLPRNIFFQVFSFIARLGIGIWLVPYMIRHLGNAAYGLIPIAAVMTEYVNIISHSISGAVSRFLTISLQKNDQIESNKIFNTAFFSYLVLALLQIPVYTLIIYNTNNIFSIPVLIYEDAIILFVCSAAAFLINLATSVYSVPLYAFNRLDITRLIEIISQIARLIGIVSLFLIFRPSLRYIGFVDLSIRILACIANVILGKITAPSLKLNLYDFDWSKVKQLTMMGGWLIINHIGFLLFLRIDVWVCNRFIGAEAAGEYAAILPWSNYMRQGAQLLAGVISPMILIYFARSEMNKLIRLNCLSVQLFSLIFAIPISILCVFSSSFLNLWLGASYTHLAPLMVILIAHLVINLGVLPLFSIQTAFNKVKWPAIITVIMGGINFLLAIIFIEFFGWGIYSVAISSAIVLTFKNALFTPIYAATILKRPWYFFLKTYVLGLLFFCSFILFGLLIKHYFHPQSWAQLIGLASVIGVIGVSIIWLILSREDRQLIIDLIPNRLQHFFFRFI